MITYAQNFEDVMLARLFAGQATGFYVDVGASHPAELSVTKHFYDMGWSGLNIEPIQRNFEIFQKERPRDINVNVAIGERKGRATFHEVEGYDALSTFDADQARKIEAMGYRVRSYPVDLVTGNSVLDQYAVQQRIDFLKIDVEGFEAQVLRSIDLKRFKPRVIVVEAITPAYEFEGWDKFAPASTHEDWEPSVLAAGYVFAHFDGISRYYVSGENVDLIARLRVPPGVFDGIVFSREAAALDARAAADAALAAELQARQGFEQALAEEKAARHGVETSLTAETSGRQQAQAAFAKEQLARQGVEAALASEQAALASEQAALASEQAARAEVEAALAAEQAARRGVEAALAAERNRGFRERVRDLRIHLKNTLRNYILAGLMRIASGKAPRPLPSISLVIPVFNAEGYVNLTLESVLSQEYPGLEVIVVDGGSTDGTLDIIRRHALRADCPQRIARVITEPDDGMYDAIAKGFAAASGEIFCYLNADDLLESDALLSVGRFFASRPKVQVIYHEDVVLVEGWKYPNIRQPSNIDVVDLLNSHILFQDGVFFRREAYRTVGGVRRDLRYAGDYDLWLRLAARFRFVRRPHHVSCFRIRPGQLSMNMNAYHAEMGRSRADFLRARSLPARAAWRIARACRRVLRNVQRRRKADRLFFPIDFGNLPPPKAIAPQPTRSVARSPIDGRPAERLLFSAMDTRFGEIDLNHIYLDVRHGISITHPPIEPERLDALYRKHYSSPPTEMTLPVGTSPYRQIDRMPGWEKALLRLPVDKLGRLFPTAWADNTLSELTEALAASGIDASRPLRFLDTGCFEGNLLDQIRAQKPWIARGLEPNETAVGVARGKGHEVWQGHADNATELIPEHVQFDVIFMGQSIEHVDDPVLVVRRLRMLLAPGGVLVMSTPNLDSRQIDWFGPTWAHWHPPYHRYIFSRPGLFALARRAGMQPKHFATYSHPYWTAITLAQNWLGLGGSASHAVQFDRSLAIRAQRIDFWARLFWNHLGKGDYSFLVLADGEK